MMTQDQELPTNVVNQTVRVDPPPGQGAAFEAGVRERVRRVQSRVVGSWRGFEASRLLVSSGFVAGGRLHGVRVGSIRLR